MFNTHHYAPVQIVDMGGLNIKLGRFATLNPKDGYSLGNVAYRIVVVGEAVSTEKQIVKLGTSWTIASSVPFGSIQIESKSPVADCLCNLLPSSNKMLGVRPRTRNNNWKDAILGSSG
ncbi:hypothetical protein ASE00_19425 [Sphingomonas sp. Root710]|nr:hypothetical protein ASE00_19425 [Sphingomonas sp. Root710]